MITAIDTNVLLDIFTADPAFGEGSAEALRLCMLQGQLVACDVVFAEIAASFPNETSAYTALAQVRVDFSPLDSDASLKAGAFWKKYRQTGGKRERIISDFLVGSHALLHADRLLTRDRGFYRKYFSGLQVLDPAIKNKG